VSSALEPPSSLVRHIGRIEAALDLAVPPDSALARSARYAMGWDQGLAPASRGKRIRPSLCLLAAECVAGNVADALPGAVAIELAHNFSLVHDDIQDRDLERHGRPTVWKRIGEAQAINVGDFLCTIAIDALMCAPAPPEARVACARALLDALGRMLHGQWSDIQFESEGLVLEPDYLAMVANKTGALLGASLQIGALLAGAPPAAAEALRAWGEQLGVAFQVRDDYLGTWGDPGDTGKSNASDIARKKRTLPIVLALGMGGDVAATVEREYGRSEPDVAVVVDALNSARIGEAIIADANRRADAAIEAAVGLPLGIGARQELAAVAAFLVQRVR